MRRLSRAHRRTTTAITWNCWATCRGTRWRRPRRSASAWSKARFTGRCWPTSSRSRLLSLKADEALRPAVEACLHPQALRDTRDTSLVEVFVQVDKPPVGMGFNMSWGAGGHTQLIGPVAWSTDAKWWAFNIDVPPDIRTIDFIFTSDAAAAIKRNAETPTS